MSKPDLGAALRAGQFVVAPGIHDMIAAVLSNEVGFDFVYASGFWLTASAYGLPDAGIATYTQMLDRVSTLARTVNAGVIADADRATAVFSTSITPCSAMKRLAW